MRRAADLLIFAFVAALIYGVAAMSHEWRTEFQPATVISLSVWALPKYIFFSAFRGTVAYLISLLFTLLVGYVAANSKIAERLVVPLLDILQNIPVLGFLPGLVLGLIAVFPNTNLGIELAAIVMVFLGQVRNMTFSFYSSLKSIPEDFKEASTIIGFSRWDRLMKVELPFSAVSLAWNSVMSVAAGWFFLSVCEAFNVGRQEFRLPGVGSYMAVAIAEHNRAAMWMGVSAMIILIVGMEFIIWRPILASLQRFGAEEVSPDFSGTPTDPLMHVVLRESRIVRWSKVFVRRFRLHRRHRLGVACISERDPVPAEFSGIPARIGGQMRARLRSIHKRKSPALAHGLQIGLIVLFLGLTGVGAVRLFEVLSQVSLSTWSMLLRNTVWTLLRVFVALVLSTLWAVPTAIWLGLSPKRLRIAQPLIQVLASFPAPMIYPIAVRFLFGIRIGFDFGSMLLMLLGVQWYVLFNVLAGALKIPRELGDALSLMKSSRWDRWKTLYIPSIFPSLVTGWMVAAGGAWNASIVAEFVPWQGGSLFTNGLGSTINLATATGNFPLLAASLTVMVLVVVLLNRVFWTRLHELAQTRFRPERTT